MICHFRVKHFRDTNKNIPKKQRKKKSMHFIKIPDSIAVFSN